MGIYCQFAYVIKLSNIIFRGTRSWKIHAVYVPEIAAPYVGKKAEVFVSVLPCQKYPEPLRTTERSHASAAAEAPERCFLQAAISAVCSARTGRSAVVRAVWYLRCQS